MNSSILAGRDRAGPGGRPADERRLHQLRADHRRPVPAVPALARPGDAGTLAWHLFVPALNEERVIGDTIDYLRATFPQAHVWVIDDDSDDDTASDRRACGPGRTPWSTSSGATCRRPGPARGTRSTPPTWLSIDWLPATADRSPDDHRGGRRRRAARANCLDVCAGASMFGDPAVGSVQVQVRMLNRDDRAAVPGPGPARERARPRPRPAAGPGVPGADLGDPDHPQVHQERRPGRQRPVQPAVGAGRGRRRGAAPGAGRCSRTTSSACT